MAVKVCCDRCNSCQIRKIGGENIDIQTVRFKLVRVNGQCIDEAIEGEKDLCSSCRESVANHLMKAWRQATEEV